MIGNFALSQFTLNTCSHNYTHISFWSFAQRALSTPHFGWVNIWWATGIPFCHDATRWNLTKCVFALESYLQAETFAQANNNHVLHHTTKYPLAATIKMPTNPISTPKRRQQSTLNMHNHSSGVRIIIALAMDSHSLVVLKIFFTSTSQHIIALTP